MVAIPASTWSTEYIVPRAECYSKKKVCMENTFFHTPEDAVKVEPSNANPANPLTNSVYAVSSVSEIIRNYFICDARFAVVFSFM